MKTIALIGAGSVVFAKNVIADILWHPALSDCELRLMDTDPERLRTAELLAEAVNHDLGAAATVRATADRREALNGADFVICTIGVGGIEATRDDLLIPQEFGLRQTIGDTLGVGGIFRAARSVPVLLSICRDMEELCPTALLINYTNPMAMHCLAVFRTTDIACVGLCHGVQNTAHALRMYVELLRRGITKDTIDTHLARPWGDPACEQEWMQWLQWSQDKELNYSCAGINHMAFFLRFASGEQDLYPELRELLGRDHIRRLDPVRFELFERLGFLMTETSGHTAEYVPYFMHDPREIERLEIPVNRYLQTCAEQDSAYHRLQDQLHQEEPVLTAPYSPSVEHVSRIINAVVTGAPYVFNGNVYNRRGLLITNLPSDSCVEVPCTADRNGVSPHQMDDLPVQCAALIRTNVNVQDLAVQGIIEERAEMLKQALMLDPNTAASLSLPDIDRLGERMLAVHRARLR